PGWGASERGRGAELCRGLLHGGHGKSRFLRVQAIPYFRGSILRNSEQRGALFVKRAGELLVHDPVEPAEKRLGVFLREAGGAMVEEVIDQPVHAEVTHVARSAHDARTQRLFSCQPPTRSAMSKSKRPRSMSFPQTTQPSAGLRPKSSRYGPGLTRS